MKRRNILFGGVSAAITALPISSSAHAAANCLPIFHPAFGQLQRCSVAVQGLNMNPQQCPNWCWAACCQAIFDHAGISTSQSHFVQKVFGHGAVCGKATGPMIKAGVDGPWQAKNGQSVMASLGIVLDTENGIFHPNPLSVVWDEINANRAVISGSLGHAVLIHALDYTVGPVGTQTEAVHIRDPFPGNPPLSIYSPQQFYGVNFLATLRIQ